MIFRGSGWFRASQSEKPGLYRSMREGGDQPVQKPCAARLGQPYTHTQRTHTLAHTLVRGAGSAAGKWVRTARG